MPEPSAKSFIIDEEVGLSTVAVQLISMSLDAGRWFTPPLYSYYVCQRLSDNHAPLRIGDSRPREAFSRVHSVGIMPPGSSYYVHPLGTPFQSLNCVFDKAYFENGTEIDPSVWDEYGPALMSIKSRRLEVLMQALHAELSQPDFAHDRLIDAVSNLIIVEIARYKRCLDRRKTRNIGGGGLASWQMRRIHERIQESQEIGYPNLRELAELCRISRSHLMRGFKVSTGWPIHKYVADERIRAAKVMLAKGQLTSTEISVRLGFGNPAYFATAFRQVTGKTPTDYRLQAHARTIGNAGG